MEILSNGIDGKEGPLGVWNLASERQAIITVTTGALFLLPPPSGISPTH